MASVNKWTGIGRIGKKAEVRTMSNGKRVASFSLAIDQSYKKDGKKVEKTEWVNIVVFSEGLVKVIENYTKQGSLLYIEGSLQTRKWTDNNNNDKYVTEIVLQGYGCSLQMLDGKDHNTTPKTDEEATREFADRNGGTVSTVGLVKQDESDEEIIEDDIPF